MEIEERSRDSIVREMRRVHREWPRFLTDSPAKAEQAALSLTDEERTEAYRLAPAYVAACKAAKGNSICSFAIYLKEKRWLRIEGQESDKPVTASRVAAAPFGAVWGGMRVWLLLQGAKRIELPDDVEQATIAAYEALARSAPAGAQRYLTRKGLTLGASGEIIFPSNFRECEMRRRVIAEGYPEVNRLYEAASRFEKLVVEGRYQALAPLCEPVTPNSGVYAEWRDEFVSRDWPWHPSPGRQPVVYFPIGGPGGLEAFRRAAQTAVDGGEGR